MSRGAKGSDTDWI